MWNFSMTSLVTYSKSAAEYEYSCIEKGPIKGSVVIVETGVGLSCSNNKKSQM